MVRVEGGVIKLTADVKISIMTFLITTLLKIMVGREHCGGGWKGEGV